jgi:hypothetical protein
MRIELRYNPSASSASANRFSVLDSGDERDWPVGTPQTPSVRRSPSPNGSIPVPPPCSIPAVRPTAAVSEAIPLTGWGDPVPLPSQCTGPPAPKVETPPVVDFYPSAASFPSLVIDCYNKLAPHVQDVVSFEMYQYYCSLGFWLRLSFLEVTNNGSQSTPNQYSLLLALSKDTPLLLPPPVAQYLANIGNFSLDGTLYRARAPPILYDYLRHPTVLPGYPLLSDMTEREKFDALEILARIPVPCDYTRPLFQSPSVSRLPSASIYHLGFDAPPVPGFRLGTCAPVSHHSPLVCDLLRQLGWTDHLSIKLGPFSWHPPTIRWLSEHLSGEPHLCLLSSTSGGLIQASFSEYTNPNFRDRPDLLHDIDEYMCISSVSFSDAQDYHLACAFAFNPIIRSGCLWTYPSERHRCMALADWSTAPKPRKRFLDPNLVHPDRLSVPVKRRTYLTWQ